MAEEFRADVFEGDTLLGSVLLRPLDPSMGVAGGILVPNADYCATRHARTETTDTAVDLNLRDENGEPLRCAGLDLVDYSETLGADARELAVLGLKDFTARFRR